MFKVCALWCDSSVTNVNDRQSCMADLKELLWKTRVATLLEAYIKETDLNQLRLILQSSYHS